MLSLSLLQFSKGNVFTHRCPSLIILCQVSPLRFLGLGGGVCVFVSILPSDKYEFSVFSLTWSVNLERYYTVLYAEVRERTSA